MTDNITPVAAELGLTLRAEFVPFSKSRNAKPGTMGADKPFRSLNWIVILQRDGRDSLTTDYAQGEGHAPASKAPEFGHRNSLAREAAVNAELESGRRARPGALSVGGGYSLGAALPAPSIADVLYSLAMDSSVLDYPSFEAWAAEYGYDSDSRRAETTWRACLDIALAFRAAIGDRGIEQLREAAEDY